MILVVFRKKILSKEQMNNLVLFLLSAISVYFFTFFVKKIAIKLNFIDEPEERKIHKIETPLWGGVSILAGFFLTCLISFFISRGLIPKQFSQLIFFLIGMVLICGIGLLDDFSGMKPTIKFSGQILVSIIFIFGTKNSTILGAYYITIPILIFWMVGIMNALNFLDNMDGITSGIAFILGLGFFALGILSGNHFLSFISVILIGSTLGFLFHNFHPAKIFLGDAGSMLIGYVLSGLGIFLLKELPKDFSQLLPFLLLSYAIFDITLVTFIRKKDGRSILQGGQDHSTHRIGTAMGSIKITAITVYFFNILIVLTSVIIFIIKNQFATLITTFIFVIIFLFFGIKLNNVPILIPNNQPEKE